MIENIDLLIILAVGILIGTFFHSNLWWSVDEARNMPVPLFMLIVSFLLRLSVTLIGFYQVIRKYSEYQEISFAVCLFGFWTAKILITSFAHLKKRRRDTT